MAAFTLGAMKLASFIVAFARRTVGPESWVQLTDDMVVVSTLPPRRTRRPELVATLLPAETVTGGPEPAPSPSQLASRLAETAAETLPTSAWRRE